MKKHQEGLEESMKESEFAFDSVDLLHYHLQKYHLQKISLKKGGSYIDSPKWLKKKEATISPKNKDDKRFPYAVAVALNYQDIKSHPERMSNIKPFNDQYDWKEKINFPSHKKDWKNFEFNNKPIALNVLFVYTKKIRLPYKSTISIKIK